METAAILAIVFGGITSAITLGISRQTRYSNDKEFSAKVSLAFFVGLVLLLAGIGYFVFTSPAYIPTP